ncbi:MAG: hypothetical protein V3W44_06035 [Dehalococcoidales bacterium]
MNLVKWMRKNNRTIMTIVVIVIMLGFVGGVGLQQLLRRAGGGKGEVQAYYLDDKTIRGMDIFQANNELKVLRSLFAGEMLRYRQNLFGAPDFKSRLLGELLFPDSQSAAMASLQMYQAISQGQLNVSGAEIDAFFNQVGGRSGIYWILLNAEARRAGCVVSPSQAREALKRFIPRMTEGGLSAAALMRNVINNYRLPEDDIMRIFADLLGVMVYAEIITNSEAVTTDEIRAMLGRTGEKLKTEFVQFAAADYLEEQTDPNQETLRAQFETYKAYEQGRVSDENPHGFGYKLPDRARLEYIIVRIADVAELIAQPTQNDMEKYFTDNIDLFTEEVQVDPNDPDSKMQRVKNYADVAGEIRNRLTNERKERLANLIINDALELADAAFVNLEMDKATSADFKAAAVAYEEVAPKLSQTHNITVYTGKTGMLSINGLAGDQNLGMLAMEGQSQVPVDLSKLVFAIDELDAREMGRFELPAPAMWANIGPLRDRRGAILALVRVVDAAKAEVPIDMNVSFSIKGAVLDKPDEPENTDDEVHSVLQEVSQDCKLLEAMNTCKARADEFVKLLADKTWQEAVDEYNKAHEKKDESGNLVAGSQLRSRKLTNRLRTAQQDLKQSVERFADNPMAAGYIKTMIESKRLDDRLYELLGDDKTEAKDINAIMEFKPNASYYVVKDLSRTQVTKEDYLTSKSTAAFRRNAGQSDSLALTHFNPDNVFKRLNFRWAQEGDGDTDQEKDKQQEEPA